MLLWVFQALALEVDQSLFLKILNTTQSKKTIVINRGTADGLAVQDQASFIVDSGIVAKGVLAKVSEYASLWQIYKIYQSDYLEKDKILNLKIIPPVKLTLDSNKQLVEDDITSKFDPKDPNPGKVLLVEGANDLGSFQGLDIPTYQRISQKNKEIYVLLGGSLKRSTKLEEETSLYFSDEGSLTYRGELSIGFEFWSKTNNGFFSNISLSPFLTGFYDKNRWGTDKIYYTELAGGGGLQINIHFVHPSQMNSVIPFVFIKGIGLYGQGLYQTFDSDDKIDEEFKYSVLSYGAGGGLGLKAGSERITLKAGLDLLYLWDKKTDEDKKEYKQQDLKVSFFMGVGFKF